MNGGFGVTGLLLLVAKWLFTTGGLPLFAREGNLAGAAGC